MRLKSWLAVAYLASLTVRIGRIMKNNGPRLFYADQNILDAITKGRCHFDLDAFKDEGISLSLSYESLEEFHRSANAERFLKAIEDYNPVVLEFDQNWTLNWWRINPNTFYDEWERSRHHTLPLREYFQGLSALYHGASDVATANSHNEKFQSWFAQVLKDAELPHDPSSELLGFIAKSTKSLSLSFPEADAPINEFRRHFGTDKGQANDVGDVHAIEKLWAYLVSRQPELEKQSSLEAFFQLDTNLSEQFTWSQAQYNQLVRGYTMLNWIGYHPDQSLTNENRLIASSSDGSHVGFASFCERFYTSDRRLALKATALYDYLDIPTQVHLEKF